MTITVNQLHKCLEIILKKEIQCSQTARHLLHLMYKMQKKTSLVFTKDLLLQEMLLKIEHFD